MAQIPVEKKSGTSWLWLLVILLLVGLLIWALLSVGEDEEVVREDPMAIEQSQPMSGTAGAMTLAAVMANPAAYYGQSGFTGTVEVAGPLTDRGFWITDQAGNRMFAIVIDEPRERPIDINAGARLTFTGGTIRNPAEVENLPGEPLDADTVDAMEGQQAVLVVDEDNIAIAEAA